MSSRVVNALLATWAQLTLCPCRHLDYLDHRSRTVHIRNDR